MIIGNSGCNIEINNEILVKKTKNYPKERLIKQAYKQIKFGNLSFNNIIVPKVFEIKDNWFSMEYYNCQDLLQFLQTSSINLIYFFIDTIINFIEITIELCILEKIETKIIIDKYNLVKQNNRYDKTFYELPDNIELPIGICHGDLTFSNILYNGKFILIDFLDSFLETPLIDISKIKQDTKHLWSLFLSKKDTIRLRLLFDLINSSIDKSFQKYDWFQYIQHFEILTLLRILPYSKNNEMTNFIYEKLQCVT